MHSRPPLRIPQTPTYELLRTLLKTSPVEFIYDRRVKDGMSFAKIAEMLRDRTEVYVTHELVRRWFRNSLNEEDETAEQRAA